MLQMLIVDDETSVVDNLATHYPWEDLGIGTVHRAYSAAEALACIERYPLDIVITDIRMPRMSGLELVNEIHRISKRTKCIILSGYSDFEYAKTAMQSEVFDYLLKPVKEHELMEAVQSLTTRLRVEWEESLSRQKWMQTIKEHLPTLREKLLLDLLGGKRMKAETLLAKMDELGLEGTPNESRVLMLVRMEEELTSPDLNSQMLMEYAVKNIAEELFQEHFVLWVAKDTHDYLAFLISPAATAWDEAIQRILERTALELQNCIRLYLKGRVSIILSEPTAFPGNLQAVYQTALTTIRQQMGEATDIFIGMLSVEQDQSLQALTHLYEPPLLMHLLEAGRWDQAIMKLDAVYEEMISERKDTREHGMELYFAFSGALSYILHKNGCQLTEWMKENAESLNDISSFRSIAQLTEWAKGIVRKLQTEASKETNDNRQTVVQKIHAYIENHLSDDCSLQAIADHVFLHPIYLARIYRLETKESIGDYLLRLRMERAVHLLRQSNLKIYEIALTLGYQNTPYFIKTFKKTYGDSPKQFRDKLGIAD